MGISGAEQIKRWTAWDMIFGNTNWKKIVNVFKSKGDNAKTVHCMSRDATKRRWDAEMRRQAKVVRRGIIGSRGNRCKGGTDIHDKHLSGNVSDDQISIEEKVKTSLIEVNPREGVNRKKDNKELGCKIEFLWALRCSKCKQRHACHCALNPKQEVKIEKRKKNKKVCMSKLLEAEEIARKLREENEANKKLIDEMNIRHMMEDELHEKNSKMANNIIKELENLDDKMECVEKLLSCIESKSKDLAKPSFILNSQMYRLKRSESNPNVLRIQPPIDNKFNMCQYIKSNEDCIRTTSDVYIHGNCYTNEDDSLRLCNVISQMFDQYKMEDESTSRIDQLLPDILQTLSCLNPFPILLNDIDDDLSCCDNEDQHWNKAGTTATLSSENLDLNSTNSII